MTFRQAMELNPGDQVWWNDPDEGKCSRRYTIGQIEFIGDIIRIVDREDNSVLECFSKELQ